MAILQTLLLPLVLAASAVVGDGWLGIRLADADRPTIAEVLPRSPAANAGLKAGDVIVAVNGKATRTVESLFEIFQDLNAGDWARLIVLRGGKKQDFKVRLVARPVEGRAPVRVEERRAKRPTKKPARVAKRDHRPAFLGIEIQETDSAIVVTNLVKGAPAIRAGLRRGDQVRSFNGKAVRDIEQLDEMMRGLHARDSVRIGLRRNGQDQEIVLTAAAKPIAEIRQPAKHQPAKRVVKPRTSAKKIVVRTAPTKVAPKSVGLPGFSSSLDSALDKARRSGRPLLVVFGASWCVNCASLKKSLAHPSLRGTLQRYERVWIDTDAQSALADKYDVESIPHTMIMSANGKVQKTIIGYQPPQILAQVLRAGVSTRAKNAAAKRLPARRTASVKKRLPRKTHPKKVQVKKAQVKKVQVNKVRPIKAKIGKPSRRAIPVRSAAATALSHLRAEIQRLRAEQRKQGKLLERILRELQKKQ